MSKGKSSSDAASRKIVSEINEAMKQNGKQKAESHLIDTANSDLQNDMETAVLEALGVIPDTLHKYLEPGWSNVEFYLNYQVLTQMFVTKFLGYSAYFTEKQVASTPDNTRQWLITRSLLKKRGTIKQ